MDYSLARRILENERLPAVIVDLEAFDRNTAHAARILKEQGFGQTLRLATKSIRVPDLIRRALSSDPVFQGLMCYAAEEAAFLAHQGFDDILVAYPTVQPSDLAVLKELFLAGIRIRLVVDSLAGIEAVSRGMGPLPSPFPLVLDVDMSYRRAGGRVHLGVRRSPLRSPEEVIALYDGIRAFGNVQVDGLMGYEAQVAGLGDRNPFKKFINPVARLVRKRSVGDIGRRRKELSDLLAERGIPLTLFNGGGTGSLNISVGEPWLTELTAGSGFLCGHLFDYYSNIRFEPACFFALQAVRSSDPGFITCQGGGYIASGGPGPDRLPRPVLPSGLRLVGGEGCGEVQTPLMLRKNTYIQPGDPVLFRHAKAGELAERFNEYLLVEGDRIVSRAATYRGLGLCFF